MVREEPPRVDGDHRCEPGEQVHENLVALDVLPRLDDEMMQRINKAVRWWGIDS